MGSLPQQEIIAAYESQFSSKVKSSISLVKDAPSKVTSRRLSADTVSFNMNTAADDQTSADAITKDANAITPEGMTLAVTDKLEAAGKTVPTDLSTGAVEKAVEEGPPALPFVDACFPADASVLVQERGHIMMADLRTGDNVLVKRDGLLEFEPVLAFLHAFKGTVGHVAVQHEDGALQVSPGHLVLTEDGVYKTAGTLMPGDALRVVDADGLKVSRVLSIQRSPSSDAYAPLTASGTVVVDGVVASNYASPATLSLRHSVAHAFHFPVRAYHAMLALLGAQSVSKSAQDVPALHPFLDLMYKRLRVDSLHVLLNSASVN